MENEKEITKEVQMLVRNIFPKDCKEDFDDKNDSKFCFRWSRDSGKRDTIPKNMHISLSFDFIGEYSSFNETTKKEAKEKIKKRIGHEYTEFNSNDEEVKKIILDKSYIE